MLPVQHQGCLQSKLVFEKLAKLNAPREPASLNGVKNHIAMIQMIKDGLKKVGMIICLECMELRNHQVHFGVFPFSSGVENTLGENNFIQ